MRFIWFSSGTTLMTFKLFLIICEFLLCPLNSWPTCLALLSAIIFWCDDAEGHATSQTNTLNFKVLLKQSERFHLSHNVPYLLCCYHCLVFFPSTIPFLRVSNPQSRPRRLTLALERSSHEASFNYKAQTLWKNRKQSHSVSACHHTQRLHPCVSRNTERHNDDNMKQSYTSGAVGGGGAYETDSWQKVSFSLFSCVSDAKKKENDTINEK